MEKMNDRLYNDMKGKFKFNNAYVYIESQLNIELIELISGSDHYYGHVAEVNSFFK